MLETASFLGPIWASSRVAGDPNLIECYTSLRSCLRFVDKNEPKISYERLTKSIGNVSGSLPISINSSSTKLISPRLLSVEIQRMFVSYHEMEGA